jgi:L-rhamnose mutarotase
VDQIWRQGDQREGYKAGEAEVWGEMEEKLKDGRSKEPGIYLGALEAILKLH